MGGMVRNPLTAEQLTAGKRLGEQLRQARGDRSLVEVARAAGISPETLRKIAALARVLPLSLDGLADTCLGSEEFRKTG